MKYAEMKVGFNKPYIWQRSWKDKLPKTYKTYVQYAKEIMEFEKLKTEAETEICGVVKKNVDLSTNRNELNLRLSEIFEFYSKSIIPDKDLDAEFLLKKTNANTLNKKLQGWCRNLVFNIPQVIASKPYLEFEERFKNIPAFVCLAGPSLKHNREKLRELKNRGLIIAVDTSLRPMLDVGIVPDFVVTHDANPNGLKFFLSGEHPYNKNKVNFNDIPDEALGIIYAQLLQDKERLNFKYDTIGFFVNYCHPLTLLAFNGSEKRFYGVFDPALPVYDTMSGACDYKLTDEKEDKKDRKDKKDKLVLEKKGRVVGGSSVGHVAAYIAVNLGCSPVCFLGLDLSYPGGKTYIEGASNQKDATKQKLIEMEDLSGNKVPTNLSMLSYKMVFERSLPHIIMARGTRFYNCTEDKEGRPAGILEVGAEPKSLQWVLDNECRKEVDVKQIIKNIQAGKSDVTAKDMIDNFSM